LEFASFAGKNRLPLYIVFTKADKQSSAKTKATVEAFSEEMLKEWEALPPMVISSAISGLGRDEVFEKIEEALNAFESNEN
jgi:GTP-binding protein